MFMKFLTVELILQNTTRIIILLLTDPLRKIKHTFDKKDVLHDS